MYRKDFRLTGIRGCTIPSCYASIIASISMGKPLSRPPQAHLAPQQQNTSPSSVKRSSRLVLHLDSPCYYHVVLLAVSLIYVGVYFFVSANLCFSIKSFLHTCYPDILFPALWTLPLPTNIPTNILLALIVKGIYSIVHIVSINALYLSAKPCSTKHFLP